VADNYQDIVGKVAPQFARDYTPQYQEDMQRRMRERYEQEIPAAQAMREAAMSGQMGAQQRLGLGQGMQQQAVASAGANPLAARAAQFGGAQAGFQTSMQGAQAGQQELEQARQAELSAYMRQVGYGQQMQQEDMRRKAMLEQARQAAITSEIQRQLAEDERSKMIALGGMKMGADVGAALGQSMQGGGR
jgi:hypothetical protein